MKLLTLFDPSKSGKEPFPTCAGGSESEVGLVHNFMRFEAFKGDILTRFAPWAHLIIRVSVLGGVAVSDLGGCSAGCGFDIGEFIESKSYHVINGSND